MLCACFRIWSWLNMPSMHLIGYKQNMTKECIWDSWHATSDHMNIYHFFQNQSNCSINGLYMSPKTDATSQMTCETLLHCWSNRIYRSQRNDDIKESRNSSNCWDLPDHSKYKSVSGETHVSTPLEEPNIDLAATVAQIERCFLMKKRAIQHPKSLHIVLAFRQQS